MHHKLQFAFCQNNHGESACFFFFFFFFFLVLCLISSQSDVREVEIARMLKLQSDKLEPVKFIVPRQRKDYFQDDLFPPTRSCTKWASEAGSWLSSTSDCAPVLESVCPAGMTPVSTAPPVEKEKKVAKKSTFFVVFLCLTHSSPAFECLLSAKGRRAKGNGE